MMTIRKALIKPKAVLQDQFDLRLYYALANGCSSAGTLCTWGSKFTSQRFAGSRCFLNDVSVSFLVCCFCVVTKSTFSRTTDKKDTKLSGCNLQRQLQVSFFEGGRENVDRSLYTESKGIVTMFSVAFR